MVTMVMQTWIYITKSSNCPNYIKTIMTGAVQYTEVNTGQTGTTGFRKSIENWCWCNSNPKGVDHSMQIQGWNRSLWYNLSNLKHSIMQCCGSVQFFSGSGSADSVLKIRIRIQVTPQRPDPTGSRSGSYLDMFLMFSKINTFLWPFYTKSKHLMTL